jgi:hypothetical protein
MAITIRPRKTSRCISARAFLAVALVTSVVLGCTRRSNRKDDDDDDERASAARASAASVAPVNAPPVARSAATWYFDRDAAAAPPVGFSFGRTGSGRVGHWVVRAVPDAPSTPNVLAQEDDDDTDYRFPVAVEDSLSFGDASVSMRCKPVSGRVDQACGVVWRYRDENNYYLARANALEDNVRFYYVENGRRHEVEGWNGKVSSAVWHQLRADMRGDRVEVYFDGTKVIDAHDSRFPTPGRVGVWTKADSRTLFDDLTASPLGP